MKICTCVIDKINKLKTTTEIIKTYLTNPIETLEADVARVQLGTNVLEEEITRNILVGVASENTKQFAINLGKRHLVDSLTNQVNELSKYFQTKVETFGKSGKRLDNAMKALDSIYTDGVVNVRVMDIQSSPLYQDYFKNRLQNDFLPTLNGSSYKMSIELDIDKVILIMRYFLIETTTKDELVDFSSIFGQFTRLIETFEDTKRIEAGIPSDALDPVEGVDEKPFDVAVLDKRSVGTALMEIAKNVPELDTTKVDLIESVGLLLEKFDKCYDKLSADVQAISNILTIQYPADINKAMDLIKTRLKEVSDAYIDIRTTDDEFNRVITNSINSIIRLLSLDTYISDLTTETTNKVAKDVAEFIGLYHLYRDIMMHSMKLGKARSKAPVVAK